MDIKHDVAIKSWDGTWTYRPKVLVTPNTVDDLVEIMTSEVRFPSPVRPAGSMHSTARMNGDETGGTMVNMMAMNRILRFGADTVTVEAGVNYLTVSNALKERGLQFHVTTEIGNATLAAMATAATKDSSFPDEYGQVSSYVTAVKLVTPQGDVREINERDHPEEMQIIRSSYGLLGIVFEVTMQGEANRRPQRAPSFDGPCRIPQALPGLQGARLCGDVLHLSLCRAASLVELRKDNPERQAEIAPPLELPQPLLAQIRAGDHALDQVAHDQPGARAMSPTGCISSSCARAWCGSCAATRPGRTRRSSTIRATRAPTNISSACGRSAKRDFFDILEAYCDFLRRLRQEDRLSLRPAERRLFHRRRTATRSCLIAGTAPRSPSTRPRPAARSGRTSSRSTTNSVASGAASRCSTRRRS